MSVPSPFLLVKDTPYASYSVSATRLTGGMINFVWRLENAQGHTVVLKYASDVMSAYPNAPMSIERLEFEVRGLCLLNGPHFLAPSLSEIPHLRMLAELGMLMPQTPGIHVPRLLHYDSKRHFVVLEDLGSLQPYNEWNSPEQPARSLEDLVFVSRSVGQWVARLHGFGAGHMHKLLPYFANTPAREFLGSVFYDILRKRIAEHPLLMHDKCELVKAVDEFVEQTQHADAASKTMLFGDLWSGSILFDPAKHIVNIVDLEFADTGLIFADIGHFAAHLLPTHFLCNASYSPATDPCPEPTIEFLRAYKETLQKEYPEAYHRLVTPEAARLSAVFFGMEIARDVLTGYWCRCGKSPSPENGEFPLSCECAGLLLPYAAQFIRALAGFLVLGSSTKVLAAMPEMPVTQETGTLDSETQLTHHKIEASLPHTQRELASQTAAPLIHSEPTRVPTAIALGDALAINVEETAAASESISETISATKTENRQSSTSHHSHKAVDTADAKAEPTATPPPPPPPHINTQEHKPESNTVSFSSSESPLASTFNNTLHRDAKTLKDRFNYASADCAAVVLKANREARGLTAILNPKKDQYMLNKCSAGQKFVIVELCDDILIDTIVLGNYEFFSSTFKDLMIYVSDRYPPKNNQWTFLGHFQGRNSRDSQVFPVADPKIWTRYVKVEFQSQYGQEFYCPLTVFKVYGATQMEQYRKEEEEEDDEIATLTVGMVVGSGDHEYKLRFPYRNEQLEIQEQRQQQQQQYKLLRIGSGSSPAKSYLRDMQGLVDGYEVNGEEPSMTSRAAPMPKVPNLPWDQAMRLRKDAKDSQGTDDDDEDEEEDEDAQELEAQAGSDGNRNGSQPGLDNDKSHDPSALGNAQHNGAPLNQQTSERLIDTNDPKQGTASGPREKPFTGPEPPGANLAQRGQESIFKTIMRRLNRVERNITLAYHYLEEQHMVFNLVLQQVEMNNLENMQLAIRQLNHSTAKQMKSLTTLSEEVWRAILYDLEEYQQKTQLDMDAMSQKLQFLAEEVLFEKRMNVAQLVLLLTIVVLVAVNKVVTRLALIPESKKEK
ncbi:hypothetical protein FB645_001103 [Coemansia sp. IMI 203386]|nr:hypothetical protein FB645_001103 [Coemansia sp. IMI 203386]